MNQKKKIRILSMNQLIGQSAVKKKKIRIANQKPFYYCAPGTVVSEEILQRVEEINETYSKLKDFTKYMQDFANFFKLEEPINATILKMFFTVSFVGGQASLNIRAKKLKTAKFGVILDSEFTATEHINDIFHLYAALSIFKTGRIRHKGGAEFVFVVCDRVSIQDKVIPFFESYVLPYASFEKVERMQTFKELLLLMKSKEHLNLEGLINKVLPLWDSLRGQKNQAFENLSLAAAQDFVRNHSKPLSPKSTGEVFESLNLAAAQDFVRNHSKTKK
jgi:hypothetical protein